MTSNGLAGRLARMERLACAPPCAGQHVRLSVDGTAVPDGCPSCGRPLRVLRVSIETAPDREP